MRKLLLKIVLWLYRKEIGREKGYKTWTLSQLVDYYNTKALETIEPETEYDAWENGLHVSVAMQLERLYLCDAKYLVIDAAGEPCSIWYDSPEAAQAELEVLEKMAEAGDCGACVPPFKVQGYIEAD